MNTKHSEKRRTQRRRWWQVLCRAAVIVAAAIGGGYVTVPWWAPRGAIKDYVARRMARQTGLDVKINSLSLSWGGGLEIRGLTIGSTPGTGPKPMVRVKAIRMDFSPVDLLLRNRVEWVELDQPFFSVRRGPGGDFNIERLARLDFDAKAQRITQQQGTAIFVSPGRGASLVLDIRDLQVFPGKMHGIGKVTMAAWLKQKCGAAPVSFHFTDQPTDSPVAAEASFSFTGLDLGELGLKDLLELPLERLGGRCDGSLDLAMDRQGKVDRFAAKLAISDLDVQPAGGPSLPLIKRAGFDISASIDLFASQDTINVELASSAVRLPGIDLEKLHLSMTKLLGEMPQIRSLDLSGTIYPGRLAALLKGQDGSAEGLTCSGPVRVEKLIISRAGPALSLTVAADATEAELSRLGKPVKPQGRKFRVELQGALDQRKWEFFIERSRLELAGNWIEYQGQLADIRPLRDNLVESEAKPIGQVLRDISAVSGKGRLGVQELQSLLELMPSLSSALSEVELRGPVSGNWQFASGGEHAGSTAFEANLTAEAQADISVKDIFAKPPDKPIHLNVAGHVISRGPAAMRGRDIDLVAEKLDLAVGRARLHTDGGQLRLRGSDKGAATATIEAAGRFDISHLETLLACLPKLRGLSNGISGNIRNGRYEITPAPGRQDLKVSADLTDVSFALGDLLAKPAKQGAELKVSYTRDETAAADKRHRLDLAVNLFAASQAPDGRANAAPVSLRASIPLPQAHPGEANDHLAILDLEMNNVDAPWLVRSSPRIAQRLQADRLAGAVVSGLASMTLGADGSLAAQVSRQRPLSLQMGQTSIAMSGTADLQLPAPGGEGENLQHATLNGFDVHLEGKLDVDKRLCELVGWLEQLAQEHGIRGSLDLSADLKHDGQTIHFTDLKIKADALAVDKAGPLAKPAGVPADILASGTVDSGLTEVKLEKLSGQIGDVSLKASGFGRLDYSSGAPAVRDWQVQLAASTDRADGLGGLVPAWRKWNLSGAASAEAELAEGGGTLSGTARIAARNLNGRCQGAEFSLSGELILEGVGLRDGELVRIDRARTDGLEGRLGPNRAWIIADLERVLESPRGTIDILAESIDDEALHSSLKALASLAKPTTQKATTAPQQEDSPEKRADRIIAKMRELLGEAELTANISLDRLKKHDASVQQHYDVRCFELRASAIKGKCKIAYAGGLNGGFVGGQYVTDLNAPTAMVEARTEFKDIIATESIQPQLSKYFPGNQVNGYFNRSEELAFPLVDLAASVLGSSARLRSSGKARTVTLDGVVVGKAAPQFISDIFPGLNLATYQYRIMTGFAELKEDGSAINDMIFDGRLYDLYITGTTDAGNIGRYQIGVILLSAPQSPEWNHLYRLGRIALLNFEARIEGGQMHDVKVSYLRPDEIIGALLLTNNPLYRVLFGQ